MTDCPKCGRPAENTPTCRWCGYARFAHADLQAEPSPNPSGGAAPPSSEVPAAKLPPEAADAVRQPHTSALFIILLIAGIGSILLLASAMRSQATTAQSLPTSKDVRATSVPANDDRAAAATPVVAPMARPAPRWVATGPARRGPAGLNGVVFELTADEDIDVWRQRVRPVLTVRCVKSTIEAFVLTHSSASFERETNQHTVQLRFDEGETVPQLWEHSVDHDALFAPDGRALARQLASAHAMSFTFTPFNAAPASVRFSVAGFDAQWAGAAKHCGRTP